jgi:predicted phage terminase large subunit-like protein
MSISKAELFAKLSKEEQIKRINLLSDEEAELLSHDWDWYARDKQRFPNNNIKWTYWLVMAGRGFGKTRVGAEWIREQVKTNKYCNLMGATKDDAIDIMIEGESGILAICNKYDRPTYKKGNLYWPNGAISLIFSAEEPERLRGKQHMKLWADELGAWKYQDSWDQAVFGLRLGKNPQACITTTPRPTKLIRELQKDKGTIITVGTTYDNKSNLAPTFFNSIISKYEGTRLGRQELNAELLDKNENALWNLELLDELRVKEYTSFSRIIVAIDPATTSNENSDLTGIIVAGKGEDGHYYIIEDLTMLGKPSEWASVAINAYHKHRADRIVAEVNNGGDMIEEVIRNIDNNVSYKKVHATRGKIIRAEPISALYEQKKVHHIGTFSKLEDQMCNFTGLDTKEKSPDRLDAMVWAMTELSENKNGGWLDFIDQEKNKNK